MIEALLNFDFMRYSLLSGILIGFIAPLIGALYSKAIIINC